MSLTPEEATAIEADIRRGMQQIFNFLTGAEKALPVAISNMHPHATATRKYLKAANLISEARAEMGNALKWDVKLNPKITGIKNTNEGVDDAANTGTT